MCRTPGKKFPICEILIHCEWGFQIFLSLYLEVYTNSHYQNLAKWQTNSVAWRKAWVYVTRNVKGFDLPTQLQQFKSDMKWLQSRFNLTFTVEPPDTKKFKCGSVISSTNHPLTSLVDTSCCKRTLVRTPPPLFNVENNSISKQKGQRKNIFLRLWVNLWLEIQNTFCHWSLLINSISEKSILNSAANSPMLIHSKIPKYGYEKHPSYTYWLNLDP